MNHSMTQRKFVLVLGLSGLLLFFTPFSPAQAEQGDWNASLFGGGVFPNDNDLDQPIVIGGRIMYSPLDHIEVGAEVSWMEFEDKLGSTKLGDVNHVPFYLLSKVDLNIEQFGQSFVPYFLGGVGFSYWNYDESISTISADDDVSFTGKLGGGVELRLQEQLAVFVEGGYFWAKYDLSGTLAGISVSGTTEADSVFVQGGVRVSF